MLTEQEYYMTYDDGKWTAYDIPEPLAKNIYTEPRVLYGGPKGQDFTGYKIWVKPKTSNMILKYADPDMEDYYLTSNYYSFVQNATGHFQPINTWTGPLKEDGASVWYWKDMTIGEALDIYKDRQYQFTQKPKFVPGKNCLF